MVYSLFLLTLITAALATVKHKHEFTDSKGKHWSTSLDANEPNLCDTSVQSYSGYFAATSNKKYFYWFFESRNNPTTSPTIMWLTGGPGCSSIMAMLVENGPCFVNTAATDTVLNEYSWNTNANVFWIDQPPGTGFSTGLRDNSEAKIAADMYAFLLSFISAYPLYFKNGFYVIGESYAGHYIPAITRYIYDENMDGSNTNIPLVGFAIGNGLTDPYIQFEYYAQMAYNSTTADSVISESVFNTMTDKIAECQTEITACNNNDGTRDCDSAYEYCMSSEVEPVTNTGINPYNLDIKCEYGNLCYNFTQVDAWLNNDTVQEAIGVDMTWKECSTDVNMLLMSDWMIDYQEKLTDMLNNGIRGLIYAGDLDFICNYMGNQAWALKLPWNGMSDFNKASVKVWQPDSGVSGGSGNIRSTTNFTFLQVFKAGHMVPMDQPKSAWYMVNQFITDKLG